MSEYQACSIKELEHSDLTCWTVVSFSCEFKNYNSLPLHSVFSGLGVNIFAIWRLSCGLRNAEKHCFHKLLLSLSICDLIHLILTVVCFSLPQISERYKNEIYLYLIPYFIPLAQMSLCSSTLTTVALTIERYISLCNPFFRYRFNVKAWHFMATVITFSICYNLPRFFEFKTNSILETKSCYVGPDAGKLLSSIPWNYTYF